MGIESGFSMHESERPQIDKIEKLEQRRFEGKKFEKVPTDERLEPEEAIVYQEYATKKEGIAFSERAGGETYEEADRLIKKLRDANFSWLDVDWKKFDLKNVENLASLEERLDRAARLLVESKKNDPALSRFRRFINAHKGILLPLSFSAALFLEMPVNEAAALDFPHAQATESPAAETEYSIDLKGNYRFAQFVVEWKAKYPQIQSVVLQKLDYEADAAFQNRQPQGVVKAKALFVIKTTKGEVVQCEGSYTKKLGNVFRRHENIAPTSQRWGPGAGEMTGKEPIFSQAFVEGQAIKKALESCTIK